MFNSNVSRFIKDAALTAILAVIGYFFALSAGEATPATARFVAFYAACIPCGWRWASHIITAYTLTGIGLKLLIALFLGMFATPCVLAADFFRMIASFFRRKEAVA